MVLTVTAWVGGQIGAAAGRPDWHALVLVDGPNAKTEREAIVAALQLLGRLPTRVAVIDALEARPDVRTALLRLDAFVVQGSPTIYVVRQSELLSGARARSAFHTHALAAVLWHEMAHVDGAGEQDARRREEGLWRRFVRDQRLDPIVALRYLQALSRRPPDLLRAAR